MPKGIEPNLLASHVRHWNDQTELFVKTHRNNAFITAYSYESMANDGPMNYWQSSDFGLSLELDTSDPIPIISNERRRYLLDMLSKPEIDFSKRDNVSLVWIASNCYAQNHREQFVFELMKTIQVDSYALLRKSDPLRNKEEDFKFPDEIYRRYKFAITIENSNCVDYVTEKPFQAFRGGAIPIVATMGTKPDYLRFFPSHSFINALEFDSTKRLASFVSTLANDKSLYDRYHYFRTEFTRHELDQKSTDELTTMFESRVPKNQAVWNYFLKFAREKNFYCAFAQYLNDNDAHVIYNRAVRRRRSEHCEMSVF
ncbi:hypothetical protein ACOME3_001293 [Neoechinorhynchus agilis]